MHSPLPTFSFFLSIVVSTMVVLESPPPSTFGDQRREEAFVECLLRLHIDPTDVPSSSCKWFPRRGRRRGEGESHASLHFLPSPREDDPEALFCGPPLPLLPLDPFSLRQSTDLPLSTYWRQPSSIKRRDPSFLHAIVRACDCHKDQSDFGQKL